MILLNKEMPPNCAKCEFQKTCNTYLAAWTVAKDRYSLGQYERIKDCPMREYNPIGELQEIRQEIEKTVSRYTISRERGTMGQVEWSDRLIKESDVFEIIDKRLEKYKENAG